MLAELTGLRKRQRGWRQAEVEGTGETCGKGCTQLRGGTGKPAKPLHASPWPTPPLPAQVCIHFLPMVLLPSRTQHGSLSPV